MPNELSYEEKREVAEFYYQSLGPINCPAIGEEIHFVFSEGFHHIVYKSKGSLRPQKDQIMRFSLLKRAVQLVSLTTTIQEFEEMTQSVMIKMNKEKINEYRLVKYWGLIAIIDNRKIKVVLRKIGNGATQFWSVIPAWTTSAKRDVKFKTMRGDPEID